MHARAERPSPSVRIYYPAERLQSYVTFYYFVETAAPLDDFLYPEWGNVRFSIRGEWRMRLGACYPADPLTTSLFGPTDRAARVSAPGGKTVGFGLTPLGWERLVEMPADALANRVGEIGDLLGPPADTVRQSLVAAGEDDAAAVALFDRLIGERLAAAAPNTPRAITVDRVLRDRPASVAEFARAAGLSAKTLRRACLDLFGFSPKRLLRRQRFLDTLGNIRVADNPEFSALIDPQYFDQSHFNNEFREFMGLTPREYLGAPRPLMGQAAAAQTQIGIPLSFRLPPQPERSESV